MAFDWIKFFASHRINYVSRGSNVAKGNVNIHCPYCGLADKSEHLGVNLTNGFWGCWRNKKHRGKSPVRLIQKLLGCSYSHALSLIGKKQAALSDSFTNMAGNVDNLFDDDDVVVEDRYGLLFPDSFRDIKQSGVTKKFFDYLVFSRGFEPKYADKVITDYDLKCSLYGKWKNRIIIPVFHEGTLMTWTGRSIEKTCDLRYLTLSYRKKETYKKGDPLALLSIKKTVFNSSELIYSGGHVLFITEGPFDSIKLDTYSRKYRCRATCLHSMTLDPDQSFILAEIAKNFKTVVILLDSKETDATLELTDELRYIGAISGVLPAGIDDPGDLNRRQIKELCRSYS